MSITRSSLASIPTSFATVSLGTSVDDLKSKLKAISSTHFQAIELGFPDLLTFASKYHGRSISENDYDLLCSAASEVKTLCKTHNLKIMMLQPFSNFEGWGKGSRERADAFERAKGWMRIMEALGTDMLQVGSSDSEGISGDIDVLAGDLGELADLAAEKGFRIAYENWCWATHAVSLISPSVDVVLSSHERTIRKLLWSEKNSMLTFIPTAHLETCMGDSKESQQTQPRSLPGHLSDSRRGMGRSHQLLRAHRITRSSPETRTQLSALVFLTRSNHPTRKDFRPANL
jgi:hypothetical protein